MTKEVTGDTIDDVFPDSSTASHDHPVAKPEEGAKTVTMPTGAVNMLTVLHIVWHSVRIHCKEKFSVT